MTKKKGTRKYSIGSIVAVPLPDGRYAFAKVFKDMALGVYDFLSDKIPPASEVAKRKIAFYHSVTDASIKSGEWPIIGEEPFPDEDSAWAPPRAMGPIPGLPLDPVVLRIEHRGVARRATIAEATGLDISLLSPRPELFVEVVIDRLVHGQHDKYRVTP
jgi:hypothetical protein